MVIKKPGMIARLRIGLVITWDQKTGEYDVAVKSQPLPAGNPRVTLVRKFKRKIDPCLPL